MYVTSRSVSVVNAATAAQVGACAARVERNPFEIRELNNRAGILGRAWKNDTVGSLAVERAIVFAQREVLGFVQGGARTEQLSKFADKTLHVHVV